MTSLPIRVMTGATAHDLKAGNALITGAATSSGSSVALAFAEHGCRQIFLADTSLNGLVKCRDSINKRYPSVKMHIKEFDSSSEEAVDLFFAEVVETMTRIDFAVNVVSQAQESGSVVHGLSVPGYDKNFQVYQRAAFMIQRGLLRQMLKQDVLSETDARGSIVNVVDHGPTPTLADLPVLAVVAFAIVGYSKTDACDYAPDKIRVNCLAASEVMVGKTKAELPGGVPLPRKGSPDDVANAAVWLSAPGSSWLTGLVVPVDGGRGLHHWW